VPIDDIEGILDMVHANNLFEKFKVLVSRISIWEVSERGVAPVFNGNLLFPNWTCVKALTARIRLIPAGYQLLLRFSLDMTSE
jgi:hypothetical protein